MKLESMTPPHSPLVTPSKSSKDLVKIPSYIVTNRNHRTVNERYTCTFTKGIELHEKHHLEEYTRHEFYKTIIGYRMGELFVEAAADAILIILLKIAIGTEMIAYKNRHPLSFGKSSFTISVTFPITILVR